MDDEILEKINNFNKDDLDYLDFFTVDIKYKDIMYIWQNMLEVTFFGKNKIDFEIYKKILYSNCNFRIILEKIFNNHIYKSNDNLILFYKKNTDKVLLLYKSYQPLILKTEIGLPFWHYYLESKNITKTLNLLFKENENILIMIYS